MEFLRWQKQVLESKTKLTFAQAARRAGKSTVGAEWIVKQAYQHRNVMYVAPSPVECESVFSYIMYEHADKVYSASTTLPMHITLNNGGTIRFVSSTLMTIGLRVGAIAYDEPERIKADMYLSTMVCMSNFLSGGRILAIGGNMDKQNTVADMLHKMSESVPTTFVYCDYLDMISDGIWTAEQARKIQEEITLESFRKEFGPWKVDVGETYKTNKDFAILLER